VTAGEDQLEPLVFDHSVIRLVLGHLGHLKRRQLGGERALTADPVDRSVTRGRDEPGAGVLGSSVARPALGRDRERVLGGLLGELEVAEKADQVREDAPPLIPEYLLDQRRASDS
jgi:hypothetical protein